MNKKVCKVSLWIEALFETFCCLNIDPHCMKWDNTHSSTYTKLNMNTFILLTFWYYERYNKERAVKLTETLDLRNTYKTKWFGGRTFQKNNSEVFENIKVIQHLTCTLINSFYLINKLHFSPHRTISHSNITKHIQCQS